MIEVALLYDLDRGVDQEAYAAWAKKVIGHVLRSPGLIQFRAHRNVLGSPQIRSISDVEGWEDTSCRR